jgi:hypothetical protein
MKSPDGVGDARPHIDDTGPFPKLGVGERYGDSDMDMDELKDWSTSIGKSFSVRVGDMFGDGKRVDGNDSTSGDDMKLILFRPVSCQEADESER